MGHMFCNYIYIVYIVPSILSGIHAMLLRLLPILGHLAPGSLGPQNVNPPNSTHYIRVYIDR